MTSKLIEANGDGWLPISEAKYNELVIVETAGGHIFKATLIPNASINDKDETVAQWAADGLHPECWTEGCCWESNHDEEPSDPPVRFMRLTPPTNEKE